MAAMSSVDGMKPASLSAVALTKTTTRISATLEVRMCKQAARPSVALGTSGSFLPAAEGLQPYTRVGCPGFFTLGTVSSKVMSRSWTSETERSWKSLPSRGTKGSEPSMSSRAPRR